MNLLSAIILFGVLILNFTSVHGSNVKTASALPREVMRLRTGDMKDVPKIKQPARTQSSPHLSNMVLKQPPPYHIPQQLQITAAEEQPDDEAIQRFEQETAQKCIAAHESKPAGQSLRASVSLSGSLCDLEGLVEQAGQLNVSEETEDPIERPSTPLRRQLDPEVEREN
jgi:hypothetical protein